MTYTREFRIERRHIAALTWDAMFRSRRAAILVDGGGGGLFDSVPVWRPAAVGCSVPLLTVVITRVCRKSGISSVFRKNNLWLFIEKKMNDLVGTRPTMWCLIAVHARLFIWGGNTALLRTACLLISGNANLHVFYLDHFL